MNLEDMTNKEIDKLTDEEIAKLDVNLETVAKITNPKVLFNRCSGSLIHACLGENPASRYTNVWEKEILRRLTLLEDIKCCGNYSNPDCDWRITSGKYCNKWQWDELTREERSK